MSFAPPKRKRYGRTPNTNQKFHRETFENFKKQYGRMPKKKQRQSITAKDQYDVPLPKTKNIGGSECQKKILSLLKPVAKKTYHKYSSLKKKSPTMIP